MIVAIGQPWASKPSNGVQPARLAVSAWRMVRMGGEVDEGEVGVEALGHAALVGQAEDALRPVAGEVD